MRDINTAKEIFERYNGMMRTSELLKEKIYYADIAWLIQSGAVEKVRQGYYQWIDPDNQSEATTVIRLFPDGILCMDTALRHYGYSDRTPAEWHIAVDKHSNRTRFNIDYPFVKPYFVAPDIFELGLCEQEIDGNKVRMYDKERIICDYLRYLLLQYLKKIFSLIVDPQPSVSFTFIKSAVRIRFHIYVIDRFICFKQRLCNQLVICDVLLFQSSISRILP